MTKCWLGDLQLQFLNAMKRAGVPVGHGLDRQNDHSISENEAAERDGIR